jgi:hypothetical protein
MTKGMPPDGIDEVILSRIAREIVQRKHGESDAPLLARQWHGRISGLDPFERDTDVDGARHPHGRVLLETRRENRPVDGMHEALITDVARLRGLRVIARSSVLGYAGANQVRPLIAEQLKVDVVLTGSVMRATACASRRSC